MTQQTKTICKITATLESNGLSTISVEADNGMQYAAMLLMMIEQYIRASIIPVQQPTPLKSV